MRFSHVVARIAVPASAVILGVACASAGDNGGDGGGLDGDASGSADQSTFGDGALGDGGGVTIFPGFDGATPPGTDGASDSGGRDSGAGSPDASDASSGDSTVHDSGTSDAPTGDDVQAHDAGSHDAVAEGAHDSGAKETGPVETGTPDTGVATCALGHLVISEIQSRGAAGGSDEFIDLYNPTGAAVTLDSTWSIEARSNASSSFGSRWAGTSKPIPSLGHYLIVGSAYSGASAGDGTLSTGITDATSLRLLHSGTTVDEVCYAYDTTTRTALMGTGYDCPGTPATNPHNDTSSTDVSEGIERLPGGAAGNCTDTGDSSVDFKTTDPSTPENTSSPPAP